MVRFWLVAFFAVAALSVARADSDATTEERARVLFAAGSERFAARDFATAAIDFGEAYDLSRRKELLWNIGVCHRELGELAPALEAFRQYLAFAGPTGSSSEKARQQIDDLERLFPARLQIHSRGKPARIAIDGVARGTTPVAAELPGGAHTLVAEGGANERLELVLRPGDQRLIEVGRRSRTGMWVGIGVGLVVVAGVVVTAAVLATRSPDLHTGTLEPGSLSVR